MSMSYRVWPSTMATRSSSACVALISIRFMVAFLTRSTPAEQARGTPWGVSPLDTANRMARTALRRCSFKFPALQHHGVARGSACLYLCCRAGGRFRRPIASHGTCSAPTSDASGDIRACQRAANMATPVGRWSRTASGYRAGGGLSALRADNSLRNQTLISPGECSRSRRPMTHPDPGTSGRRGPHGPRRRGPRRPAARQFPARASSRARPAAWSTSCCAPARCGSTAGGPRPNASWRRATRSGFRRSGSRSRATRRTPAKGLLERLDASIVFEDARAAGPQQAHRRRQPWRQRDQLRRDRDPACPAPERAAGTGASARPRYLGRAADRQEALGPARAAGADARRRRRGGIEASVPDAAGRPHAGRHDDGRCAAACRPAQGGERMVQVDPAGKASTQPFQGARAPRRAQLLRSADRDRPHPPDPRACRSTSAIRSPATTSTATRRSTSACASRSG